MASTWSALKIELLETGQNAGTWGAATNVNLGNDILGEAITGSTTVTFLSAADFTLTLTDSATSQPARNLRLNITESGAGVGYVGNLILGSGCQIEKFYLIRNDTTGAKTIKNTTGTGVAVAAGKATLVYNDGTNVVDVLNSFSSAILGAENAGSIIPFYFSSQASFPSASTYHGAIAHSHADGAMYFAHGGSWVRLLDNGGPLGTPSSGTLTNATGLPISTGVSGLGTSVATFLATPSSANLAAALTDETGTGSAVFATSPTLVTPILGTPTSGNFSTGTFTWPTFNQNTSGTAAGLSATLAPASGGTGVANNAAMTVTGSGNFAYTRTLTGATNVTFPTTGTLATLAGTETFTNKTITGTKETVFTITDGAAFEINPANGGIQTITLGANRTPAATSFTAGQSVTLMIDDGSAYAITWTTINPTFVGASATGSAPTLATSGYNILEMWKVGSTVYAAFVGVA